MALECTFAWGSALLTKKIYSCVVKSEAIAKFNTRIEAFRGDHQPGKTDKDVESVYIECSGLENFPHGLNEFFPKLTHLTINRCGLKSITKQDLNGLENLISFDISNTELKSLPNDLFENMRQLKIITFYGNKLEFMSSQILRPILENELKWVNFYKNTKIDYGYHRDTYIGEKQVSLEVLMRLIDEKCIPPIEKEEEESAAVVLELSRSFSDL